MSWKFLIAAGAIAAGAIGCAVEAKVYREAQGEAGRGGDFGGFGGSLAGLTCPGVAGVVSTGEWLRPNARCSTNEDCVMTLVTPICDLETSRCSPCASREQQAELSVRVGTCIGLAVARCCSDPESNPDCLYENCVFRCEAR